MFTPAEAQETLNDFIVGTYGHKIELTEQELADLQFFINFKITDIRQDITNQEIWDMLKKLNIIANPKIIMVQFTLRDIFTNYFSWAIPDPPIIEQMIKIIGDRTVLELGAGRGLWARLLTNAMSATDHSFSYYATNIWQDDEHYYPSATLAHTWHPIVPADHKTAVNTITAEILFICWGVDIACDIETISSSKIISQWLAQPQAQTIMIIGEGKSGCTFHLTNYKKLDLAKTHKIIIPHWMGIHDKLYVYEK